jgi:hypothetical protein
MKVARCSGRIPCIRGSRIPDPLMSTGTQAKQAVTLTGCVHGALTPAQCVLDVRLKAIVAKRPTTPNTATDANTCW